MRYRAFQNCNGKNRNAGNKSYESLTPVSDITLSETNSGRLILLYNHASHPTSTRAPSKSWNLSKEPTSLTAREEERSRGQISFSRGSVGRPLLLSKAIKASRIRVYHIREGLNKESNAHEMHGLRGIRRKKKENLRYSFMTTHLIIKASSH